MRLRTLLRHILGYLIGGGVFLVGIPCVIYLASTALDPLLPRGVLPIAPIRISLALVMGAIGIGFALWSNAWLLFVGKGGPTDAFGVAVSPRAQRLVTTGPYRYTRNPMAFGALCIYLGVAPYLDSLTGLAIVAVLVLGAVPYLKLTEEKRLLRDFGQEYEDYRSAVSMLVPWPWSLGGNRARIRV